MHDVMEMMKKKNKGVWRIPVSRFQVISSLSELTASELIDVRVCVLKIHSCILTDLWILLKSHIHQIIDKISKKRRKMEEKKNDC